MITQDVLIQFQMDIIAIALYLKQLINVMKIVKHAIKVQQKIIIIAKHVKKKEQHIILI